jgi:DNA repair exonuclease SbcCD ATPase subunit
MQLKMKPLKPTFNESKMMIQRVLDIDTPLTIQGLLKLIEDLNITDAILEKDDCWGCNSSLYLKYAEEETDLEYEYRKKLYLQQKAEYEILNKQYEDWYTKNQEKIEAEKEKRAIQKRKEAERKNKHAIKELESRKKQLEKELQKCSEIEKALKGPAKDG